MLKEKEAREIINNIKKKVKLDPEKHAIKILQIMSDKKKGTVAHFCADVCIGEGTFYNWCRENELFLEAYAVGKVISKRNWEDEGDEIRNQILPPGTVSHRFEHWRLVGWTRYGVGGKNSRIRLELNPNDKPHEHYAQLIAQAKVGDFTAGEIKQLMEAINVGMNAHDKFKLQEEIDALRRDLGIMQENTKHGNNSFSDQRTKKEN